MDIKVAYIIDKNERLHGKEQDGILVVPPIDILNTQNLDKCKFVITAPKYRKEIMDDIYDIFGNVKIYSFEAELYYLFIRDISLYRKYLYNNFVVLQELYTSLSDERSRDTLVAFIKGRISGNQKYFTDIMETDQYFPKNIIKLKENEVIVEVGSNDGNTLRQIIDITNGKFEKIYCFEPDRLCIDLLEKIIKKENNQSIILIKKGVGSKKQILKFKTNSVMGVSRVVNSEEYDYKIDITTLDYEIKGKVTMLKMDIEGMELSALKGAENIVKKQMPKLAICVYHNQEDILNIWKYLKKIQPEYKFYLRHHNWSATETVLYAI